MDSFARRSEQDRLTFINEAAARRDVTPIIIEKDFWVCWTLKHLMRIPQLADCLTFKGGTSLSKAYAIIDRFSEDIDLTIGRNARLVSDIASPMALGISGKERGRRAKALKLAAQSFVRTIALPVLATEITESLGSTEGWAVMLDPEDQDCQTILFQYPRLLSYGATNAIGENEGYIRPRIKLEFGARGETVPSELRTISPYLAATFPTEFSEPTCIIPTLSAMRTFWEKVTILHALFHGSKLRQGMSRHYYDTVMLARCGIANQALEASNLLEQVVRNKSLMFADTNASYDTATIGHLRLKPPMDLREKLKSDYAAMADMFMVTPLTFENLMVEIAALEVQLNGA
jgi:Nucleotidyl transferase AbiEii toxin, Type IV TA system